MKFLLKVLYVVLIIIILALLAGLFFPKTTHVEVSKTFRATPEIIYPQINDIKNWPSWIPWNVADTSLSIRYGDISSGQGASYDWTSGRSGSGKITILRSSDNHHVETLLEYGEEGQAAMKFTIQKDTSLTLVTWTFTDDSISYFERYFVTLFTNNMRNGMKRGLDTLEKITNDLRLSRVSSPEIVELEEQPVMVITDSARISQMDSVMERQFTRMSAYLERRKIEPAGKPVCIFYSWDPEGYSKFACGWPIPERTWGWQDYQFTTLPGGKAISVIHYGDYASPKPYTTIEAFARENALKTNDFIWEVYSLGPDDTRDTSQWEKQVFYPVLLESESDD